MAWFTPFIVPMAIGALSSMASGRNALEGAAIGAATQGLLGGVDFGGASNLFSGAGSSATSGSLTPVTTSGFGGASMFGPSATSGLSGGVATSLPATAGQYSSIYGGDAALQNYDIGMNGIQSQIGGPVNISTGNVSGMTAGADYPDYTPIGQGTTQTNGYVYSPEEIETMANIRNLGSMTGTSDIVDNEPIFGGLIGDDMSASDVMGYTQLANQAYTAQTEPTDIQAQNLPPIQRKEVEPSKGTLVAINSPRSDIDKKIRFYG